MDPVRPALRALGLDLAAFSLGLLPRLLYFAPQIDSWDAVDFALGLSRFDLLAYRPHFPGYPVFLALGWLGSGLGLSDAAALTLPGVLLYSFSLVLVRRSLARAAGDWAGLSAVALLSLLPGLLLGTLRPLSEGTGLALLLSAYSLWWSGAPRGRNAGSAGSAGLALGLALGARLSYFPAALSLSWLAWRERERRASFGLGLALGVLLWLVPLAWSTGPGTLLDEATRFTSGHFTRWGGALGAETESGPRGLALSFGLWAYQLGGLWPGDGLSWTRLLASLSAVFLSALGLRVLFRSGHGKTALVLGVPYGLWVCLGQNPDSPRHWAPLVAGLAIVWARGMPRLGLLGAVAAGLVSLPLAREQALTPGPQAALSWVLAGTPGPLRFYGWKTTRVLGYYAPQHQARLAYALSDMSADLARDPFAGPVFFESKLRQRRRRDRCFQVVATFHRSRYLEPSYDKLALFLDCGPILPARP